MGLETLLIKSLSLTISYSHRSRMIELGLSRISRLLATDWPLPWQAVHVAGTNGKGSVCFYISAMLQTLGFSTGQFSSPYLIDPWDCISINRKPIDFLRYSDLKSRVDSKNKKNGIGATEFERLTATAFHAFSSHKVDIGVVEVGLGGRLDATNVFQRPIATVITKIGLDHQSLLGNTIQDIALQKAGIMKRRAPCFIDGTNHPDVQAILTEHARKVKTGSVKFVNAGTDEYNDSVWRILPYHQYEEHQRANIALAFEVVRSILEAKGINSLPQSYIPAIANLWWPGRLQMLSIEKLTGRKSTILLDGAHNAQSASALGSYVNHRLRDTAKAVTWVLAASKGKDLQSMFSQMLRVGDNVTTVEFNPVSEMPWVEPAAANEVLQVARTTVELRRNTTSSSVLEALRWATSVADGGPLVIAGSLYLVSDVLRLLRSSR